MRRCLKLVEVAAVRSFVRELISEVHRGSLGDGPLPCFVHDFRVVCETSFSGRFGAYVSRGIVDMTVPFIVSIALTNPIFTLGMHKWTLVQFPLKKFWSIFTTDPRVVGGSPCGNVYEFPFNLSVETLTLASVVDAFGFRSTHPSLCPVTISRHLGAPAMDSTNGLKSEETHDRKSSPF